MALLKSAQGRLQFELSAEKLAEIERLQTEGGFENRKELFNNAITLLKWAINHAKSGHAIAAIDEKSDKYFELQMPFLSHVRPFEKLNSR